MEGPIAEWQQEAEVQREQEAGLARPFIREDLCQDAVRDHALDDQEQAASASSAQLGAADRRLHELAEQTMLLHSKATDPNTRDAQRPSWPQAHPMDLPKQVTVIF